MSAAVFNISKVKDEMGRDVEPIKEFGHGIIRQVLTPILRNIRQNNLTIFMRVVVTPNRSSALLHLGQRRPPL